ncbi:glycosyltransferase [Akkermansiaceae bacterium]|nr:glycosyltransferase [Akkermansiaceae bacterium]
MRILIVTPQIGRIATGNRCSAEQWVRVFRELDHEVELKAVEEDFGERGFDVLVALNAKRIPGVIERFKEACPRGRVVVVLTGTDIYPEVEECAVTAMSRADRLVALQVKAVKQVPLQLREKVGVIVQSASAVGSGCPREDGFFNLAVVGHFRAVKDPMRTAAAVRLLPDESQVRVRQVGAVLEECYDELIQQEVKENPRYQWLGELSQETTGELIAGSDLLVLTSLSEGAGRVVGEAVVNGTPVLSSRIDGVVGLLGEDYPGCFPVGDTEALSEMIWKAESDEAFYLALDESCRKLAKQFAPETEREAWRELLDELEKKRD